MSNELIFCAQIVTVCSLTIVALRLGSVALSAFVGLLWVLANLFVTKQISLFGLGASPSDALGVGAVFGINLLQEYFGRDQARKTEYASCFVCASFALLAIFQLLYAPFTVGATSQAFTTILITSPRIILASLFTFFVVQNIEYRFYGILKNRFKGRAFILRNYISMSSTQLLDTVMFAMLGLYGIVQNIWQLILFSYLVKLIVILLGAPLLQVARSFVTPQKN